MGRHKAYKSAKALEKAVTDYFDSITRQDLVMEPEDTGEVDKYGHKIFRMIPALNGKGQEVYRTVYLIPPSVGGLCDHLGIVMSTWRRYCAEETFREVTERTEDRLRNWYKAEAVSRPDKMTKGLLYVYERDHGSAEKNEAQQRAEQIRTGMQALADLIRESVPGRNLGEFEEAGK